MLDYFKLKIKVNQDKGLINGYVAKMSSKYLCLYSKSSVVLDFVQKSHLLLWVVVKSKESQVVQVLRICDF